MADSGFWRELAEQFESVDDPFGYVRANWRDDFDSGRPLWKIDTPVGDPKPALRAKCESLVRRGGKGIDPSRDSLVAWCEELRKRKINMDRTGTTLLTNNSGSQIYVSHGTIVGLVEASSALCWSLESEALETERIAAEDEKRRSDPTNWPEIVQQYEVFKSIKGLISGPHENIPEDVLRNLAAQQDGITPEEVTFDRLRFAVTQLFQRYPAITLVPTVHPEQSDSVLVDSKKNIEAPSEAIYDDKTFTNRDRIDAFIAKLLQHGTKINRTDIWLVGGYEDRSEFERFQRADPKVTKRAIRVFNEILTLSPEEFLKRLKARRS
jgi:hypothetical protein